MTLISGHDTFAAGPEPTPEFAISLAALREDLTDEYTAVEPGDWQPTHLAVLEPGRAVLLLVDEESESEWPGIRARGYSVVDWSASECSYALQQYDGNEYLWHLTGYGYLDSVRPLTDDERAQVAAVLGGDA